MNAPGPSQAPYPPRSPGSNLGRGRVRFVLARLRLMRRSFRNGWGIFMESRIGSAVPVHHNRLCPDGSLSSHTDGVRLGPRHLRPGDRLRLRSGGAAGAAQLEAPPGHRSAGPGRAEPAALQHPLRVRAGYHRGTGDRRHRHLRRGGGRLLRQVAGRLLHEAGRPDHRSAGHFVADSAERPVPSEPVLPGADHRRAGRVRRERPSS